MQDPGRFSRFSRSELPTIDTQTDSWLQRVRPSENTDVDLGGVVVLVERPVMTLPMSKQCASPGLCPFPRSAHQLGHDVIGRVVESSADSSSPRCFVPQRSVDHGGNHSFAQCGSSVIRDYPIGCKPILFFSDSTMVAIDASGTTRGAVLHTCRPCSAAGSCGPFLGVWLPRSAVPCRGLSLTRFVRPS